MTHPDSESKIFSLEGKGLKLDTIEDVEKHVGELRQMEDVVEIRLQGNTLGVEACQILGEIIKTKKTLQVANFADIFTGRLLKEIPKALKYLLDALLTLPKLHEINLNDNAFGLNTSGPLVDFLSSHVPLQHLILNNNGLGPESGIRVAEALVLLHAKKNEARKQGIEVPELETIVCGRNRLESASMMAWAKMFSLHTSVKNVKMVQNGIRSIGIYVLINDGLRFANGLKVLDLEDNTFLTKGASALAKFVPNWVELQELNIGDCMLEKSGSFMLVNALEKGNNQNLQVLRLQYNQLNTVVLENLVSVVKKSLPSLKRIGIDGNRFSSKDKNVKVLQELLIKRKEELGASISNDEWGIDPIDSDEDEDTDDSSESEEENSDPDDDQVRERVLVMAREVLGTTPTPSTEGDATKLAEKLAKVEI